MPSNPNTSFIPKQGPVRRQRQTASRSVHLFSLISYVVLASTMLASVGAFLYERHVDSQLQDRVGELSSAIGSFSESDMSQVREFNIRLAQTRARLDNGASVRAVFEAIEDATAQSVELSDLQLERFGDNSLVVKAKVETDNFDSSLFQRGVFERSGVVESVEVKDLQMVESAETEDGPIESGITFVAEINVPLSEVPNLPGQTVVVPPPAVIEEPVATTTEEAVVEDVVDTNEITP